MKAVAACAAVAVALLAGATPAAGTSQAPHQRELLLGVFGDRGTFAGLTGQHSRVGHLIVGWLQGHAFGTRLPRLLETMGEVPMLGIKTGGRITMRDIALGRGDDYLAALNRAAAEWPGRIYLRPFPEMNGHWNEYCAFDANGRPRGPAWTTAWFRKAFARLYLVVHGGPRVNAALRAAGLPPVTAPLAANPLPRVRVIWNPQGYGSPDVRGNSAQAYYPGDRYVDVVGNDLYNIRGKAEWAANEALYRAYPTKPYSIPEWGNWGIDDPVFIRRMAEFAATHPRTELLAYYNGPPGSVWDLATKPRSRRAYRQFVAPLGIAR